MKRRIFVRNSSLTMASMPFLSSLIFSCEEDIPEPKLIETDKRIVIIGAGMSGLAAAKYFKDLGVEVTVLEAQHKVGGRIRTDRSLNVPFDEGASWIHGPKNNPLTSLAQQSGASTYKTDDENVVVYHADGTIVGDDELEAAEKKFDQILDSIKGNEAESFETVFYQKHPEYKNDPLWTYMLSAYLEFDTGADIGELSSVDFYDDEAFGGDDLIITNGYDLLTEHLAQGINVQLGTPVSAIDYAADLIRVTTPDTEIQADYVLVTVPLGVLKKEVISFTPSLPSDIHSAIDHLQMGAVNKYLCVWDEPFWDVDVQYIGYAAEVKGKFNYFINVKKFAGVNALMTFTFGDYSRQAEDLSDAAVEEEIMSHLRAIYGSQTPNPKQVKRTKWVTNEFSYGAYSFATNGTRTTDFESFEGAIDDKLYFAGEHTSRDYRGTVHGAYLSGVREAKKIGELLRKG